MDRNLNVKYKTITLLEGNTGENLGYLGFSDDFLDTVPKASYVKEKLISCISLKLKTKKKKKSLLLIQICILQLKKFTFQIMAWWCLYPANNSTAKVLLSSLSPLQCVCNYFLKYLSLHLFC